MAEEPMESAAEIILPPDVRGEEVTTLTSPPMVPPPIQRNHPTKVKVKLE
jgi:hypothetical protein